MRMPPPASCRRNPGIRISGFFDSLGGFTNPPFASGASARLANLYPRIPDPVFSQNLARNGRQRRRETPRREVLYPPNTFPPKSQNPDSPDFPNFFQGKSLMRCKSGNRARCGQIAPLKPQPWPANLTPRISDPVFGRRPLVHSRRRVKGAPRKDAPSQGCCQNPGIRIFGFRDCFSGKSLIWLPARNRPRSKQIALGITAHSGQSGSSNSGPRFWPTRTSKTGDGDVGGRGAARLRAAGRGSATRGELR